jgi:multiple sugar transport system ATP-binding protein
MATVSIRQVRKAFGSVEVLHGVSVEVEDGEFVILVGPSGCGKSTLLRMIAGLENISRGEIAIGGRVVNNVAPKERDIAMVFQNYALYPHMTVRDNMAFSLLLAKAPNEVIEQKVGRAADILGLQPYLERYPRQLSGGQRQRVAMGRAIVRDPEVFLFDEPLSNLDAQMRNQVRTEIKKLHQQARRTSIYVTHDQMEAMTLADRIVLLRDGRIEQVGTPMELFARPVNRFVAGFIGSPAMNFLSGRVENGQIVLPWLRLPCPPLTALPQDGRVDLGIRPEDMLTGEACLGVPETCRFEAVVGVVEPMGPESLLIVGIGGVDMQMRLIGRVYPQAGARIGLAIDPAELHVFDAATGVALRR